ncbi:MAG: Uroporphyrinogen-III C-methyltransferase [Candidatus Methanolliviera sp. GoM_asphalt]|nr:MAG: Uroporphyrinogen-III C-methyltransferase [Candidatus Methanolliviera sp. GoM_asphalt]
MSGKVYIVGAGPGDPSLLTIRALELINEADLILADDLIGEEIKKVIPEDKLMDVGKKTSGLGQEEINRLIVDLTREKKVVRLKGGDPFLFGRGGEEIAYLKKNGVKFEIVPGITSAIAVPEIVGIPVTDRNITSTFTVITGHEKDESSRINWKALAELGGTIVILMGVENLKRNMDKLRKNGMDPKMPVSIIEKGVTGSGRVLHGDLSNIAEIAREEDLSPPAVIVVGEVTRFPLYKEEEIKI